MRLLYNGYKVKLWSVPGTSGNVYTVLYNQGKISCDCPHFQRRLCKMAGYEIIKKDNCKHIKRVLSFMERKGQ